ncbi:MAG: hypothetical protein J5497_01950 [Selenomonadaceae bacterium]|nr:hypothetical protein [Selenomonadaceae bacterium]
MEKDYQAIFDSFTRKKISEDAEIVNNYQIIGRLTNIISPNDKLIKTLFNLPEHEYLDALQHDVSIDVTEKKIRGKKVQTHFKLKGGGKILLARPLNEFDRAVLDICISAREEGFKAITRNWLFRMLTGGKTNQYPRQNQETAIIESLERLMSLIEIDFSFTREQMPKYNDAPARFLSPILPCKILDNAIINGQLATLIKFTDESPLMTIARAKKQILTSPIALRHISGQNNTPSVISIKSYVVRRVLEIIAHKMTPTITFADIFNRFDIDDNDKSKRQENRKLILKIMDNLKTQGTIKSFEAIKKDKAYYSVSIHF